MWVLDGGWTEKMLKRLEEFEDGQDQKDHVLEVVEGVRHEVLLEYSLPLLPPSNIFREESCSGPSHAYINGGTAYSREVHTISTVQKTQS